MNDSVCQIFHSVTIALHHYDYVARSQDEMSTDELSADEMSADEMSGIQVSVSFC